MTDESREARQAAAMDKFLQEGISDVKVPPAPAPPLAPPVAARPAKGENPVGWIVQGMILGLVGGGVIGFGAAQDDASAVWLVIVGVIMASIGSVTAMIGTIGAGVAMGLARYYGRR